MAGRGLFDDDLLIAVAVVAKLMHPCVNAVRQQASAESGKLLADAFHMTRIGFDDRRASGRVGVCPEEQMAQRA